MIRSATRGGWVAALVVMMTIACGEPRSIGVSCGEQGCLHSALDPGANDDCQAEYVLPAESVASGATLERCQLFTLTDLDAAGPDGKVYVRGVSAAGGPYGHDLDLRLAPEISDFEDGPVDCAELRARAVGWLPLMTTEGSRDDWDFSDAPLVASSRHRLLVNDSYTNVSSRVAQASLKVSLFCNASVPARVSQAFEFSSRDARVLQPGERVTVSAPCFSKEVLVTRLYRRTRLVTRFLVRRLDASEPLWLSESDFFVDLQPAQHFAADEGFRWECVYENHEDVPFQIGGNSSDACALLGIYHLPAGSEDEFPEHCTR